jgi:hypothetical protein
MIRKILILPLLVILFACSNDSATPPTPELSVNISTLDKFEQPSQEFIQGERITIEFSITNLTFEEKKIGSSNTVWTRYVVKNESGDIVYESSMFGGATFTSFVLSAGESRTVPNHWDQVIDRDGNLIAVGDYVLEGWFIGAPEVIATTGISIL